MHVKSVFRSLFEDCHHFELEDNNNQLLTLTYGSAVFGFVNLKKTLKKQTFLDFYHC